MTAGVIRLRVRPELCSSCAKCVRACPERRIEVSSGLVHLDAAECDGCDACVRVCPTGALTVSSRSSSRRSRSQAAKGVTRAAGNGKPVVRSGPAWRLSDAVLSVSLLMVALVAAERILGSALVGLMPEQGRATTQAFVLAAIYAAEVGLLVLLAYRRGVRLLRAVPHETEGSSAVENLVTAGLVVAGFVVTRIVSSAWVAITESIGWEPAQRSLADALGAGSAGFALSVATVVVIGPVVEELVFRGVILDAVACKWGKWAGIVTSAFLFAALHLTAWAFVPMFALGIVLGWLAWDRGSLWPAIVLHVLYNGVVVAAGLSIAR